MGEEISVTEARRILMEEFPGKGITVQCSFYDDWQYPSWYIAVYESMSSTCGQCGHKIKKKEIASTMVQKTFKAAHDHIRAQMAKLEQAA